MEVASDVWDSIRKLPDRHIVTASVKDDERGGQGHTSASLLYQSATWHRAVNKHCFYTSVSSTSYFVLSAMDGKIERCVRIQFCAKLGKSSIETLEMLREEDDL
jgi:hypothetical protein